MVINENTKEMLKDYIDAKINESCYESLYSNMTKDELIIALVQCFEFNNIEINDSIRILLKEINERMYR